MGFLPRILFILEIKGELSSILTCLLSFALDLLHLPIMALLCELGLFLGFGFPVLNLLLHVLQVLGLLGREPKRLIVVGSFQLHHLAVVLKDRESQQLRLGPLLGFFFRSFLSLIFELLGHDPLMLIESGFFSSLFLSSLILLLCDALPLPSGLLALIFHAHLLFLSFILEAGLLSSFIFQHPLLSFIFDALLLCLSFILEALSSVDFTLKASGLTSGLLLLLPLQLLLPRKFSFSSPLPIFLLLLDELFFTRERTAQPVMQIDLQGIFVNL